MLYNGDLPLRDNDRILLKQKIINFHTDKKGVYPVSHISGFFVVVVGLFVIVNVSIVDGANVKGIVPTVEATVSGSTVESKQAHSERQSSSGKGEQFMVR